MMKACDLNGDGKIDYTEFIAAAYEKSLLLSSQNLRSAFDMLDEDGDGTLTKDELKKVFGGGHVSEKGEQIWDELIASVDQDSDGMVTYAEFEAGMKSMLQ